MGPVQAYVQPQGIRNSSLPSNTTFPDTVMKTITGVKILKRWNKETAIKILDHHVAATAVLLLAWHYKIRQCLQFSYI
jgi:hypothetical protein